MLPTLSPRLPFVSAPATRRRGLAGFVNSLRLWQERANARQRLRDLDPHLLRDIGLGRSPADVDPAKPYLRD